MFLGLKSLLVLIYSDYKINFGSFLDEHDFTIKAYRYVGYTVQDTWFKCTEAWKYIHTNLCMLVDNYCAFIKLNCESSLFFSVNIFAHFTKLP